MLNISFTPVPKTSFSNIPLWVALLVTCLIHWLFITGINIDLPEKEKKRIPPIVTIIKQPPQPVAKKPATVMPSPLITATEEPVHKPAKAEKTPAPSRHPSAHTVKTPKPKKKPKVRPSAPVIPAPQPDLVATPNREDVANIAVTEAKAEEKPVTAIESAPVMAVEPESATPAIPESKVNSTPLEPVITPEQTTVDTTELPEKPVELAEKPRKKSRKKTSKKASEDPVPALSLDDLSAQIAQVGEKYANQPATTTESRIKPLNAVRKHKASARQYKQDWRQKIERIANLNFPAAARQKDFSARLVIEVGINSDGSIHSLKIKKSSGTLALDEDAKNIVQMGAPFAVFPQDLREEVDVLILQQPMQFSDESVTM